MAIESKRMQQRSGTYEQFLAHKDEFLPNEFEIVTSGDPNTPDGRAVYFSFNPSDTKRFVTKEDVQGDIAAAAKDAIAESTEIATNAAESAQNSAEQAKNYYDQIPAKVEESKQAISDYTEAMKQTIPEDYTTLSELVDELDRTRAPGITVTVKGEAVSASDASDQKLRGLRIYGKGTQDETPTPEAQQEIHVSGEGGEIGVNITGNQLFDASKLPTKSQGGATVTNNGDGSFTISGSGSLSSEFRADYTIYHESVLKIFRSGVIHINNNKSTYPYLRLVFRNTAAGNFEVTDGYEITENLLNQDNIYATVEIFGVQASDIIPGTIKPMIYQNGNGTWEPFKQPQTLSISTPNGLPGIPVESGGNYTDETGQQWISDVKDYGAGKYYQYVKEVVFDGSEDEGWRPISTANADKKRFYIAIDDVKPVSANNIKGNIISDKFVTETTERNYSNIESIAIPTLAGIYIYYTDITSDVETFRKWLQSNPVTVLYQLATPIITDIPAEEMAAYRELHSNYPNTNIFTDQTVQPGIEMDYTADTKTYVDNKIAEAVTQAITIARA